MQTHNLIAVLALFGVAGAAPALEGQYVPDNLEKLYDDGSYKPQLEPVPLSLSPFGLVPSGSGFEGAYVPQAHLVPLAASPYGLTPAGSGLEGAYVPQPVPVPLVASPYGAVPAGSGLEGEYVNDLSEQLYDDGSYKPGLYA